MKPIPTTKFWKYLKYKGLILKRTEGGHEIWDLPDNSLMSPVTLQSHEKSIPILHIKTNLKTMNISTKQFEKDIKKM